jgi:hypothetical protein
MNALLIGSTGSPYLYSLIKSLGDSGFEIDLVDPNLGWYQEHGSDEKIPFAGKKVPRLSHLQRATRLRKFLRGRHYDVCNVHYNSAFYGLLAGMLRRVADRLVVSIWGADMTHGSALICRLQRRLLDRADVVTINNPDRRDLLCRRFRIPESKVQTAYMPLEILDKIAVQLSAGMTPVKARRALGFEPDQALVLCGTNAFAEQRHHEIFDSLERFFGSVELQNGAQFVFPLTYGRPSDDYVDGLVARAASSKLSAFCLTEFLSDEEMVLLRIASVGVIQVQDEDMFSAVMQEAVFAGSWVVTGSWLPYGFLENELPTLHQVDKVADVSAAVHKLLKVEMSAAETDRGRRVIEAIAGMDSAGEVWDRVWKGKGKSDKP